MYGDFILILENYTFFLKGDYSPTPSSRVLQFCFSCRLYVLGLADVLIARITARLIIKPQLGSM